MKNQLPAMFAAHVGSIVSTAAWVMPNSSASSCPGSRFAEKPPETPANAAFSKHVALQTDLLDGTSVPTLMPDGSQAYAVDDPHFLGPVISATRDKPVRIVFYNLLPTGADGDLFLPTDSSLMGSGMGPMGMSDPVDQGTVTDQVRNPGCTEDAKGRHSFVDRSASEFGKGWYHKDLDSLKVESDGLLLITGDGEPTWFEGDGFGGYEREPGDQYFYRVTSNGTYFGARWCIPPRKNHLFSVIFCSPAQASPSFRSIRVAAHCPGWFPNADGW